MPIGVLQQFGSGALARPAGRHAPHAAEHLGHGALLAAGVQQPVTGEQTLLKGGGPATALGAQGLQRCLGFRKTGRGRVHPLAEPLPEPVQLGLGVLGLTLQSPQLVGAGPGAPCLAPAAPVLPLRAGRSQLCLGLAAGCGQVLAQRQQSGRRFAGGYPAVGRVDGLLLAAEIAVGAQQVVDGRHEEIVEVGAGQQSREGGEKTDMVRRRADHEDAEHLAARQLVGPVRPAAQVVAHRTCRLATQRVGLVAERAVEPHGPLGGRHVAPERMEAGTHRTKTAKGNRRAPIAFR